MPEPTLITHNPLIVLLVLPFLVVFVWATWLEVRRWWRYGPSGNNRAAFPIDETAPSYEPPAPEGDPDAQDVNTPNEHSIEAETMTDAKTQINETVKSNDVVLFMKGTKEMPQCGFSSRVAGVLNFMGVDFTEVNVLADENIRQGIKDYSDWPTIPQLYVKGEFVGGCDIITEMTLSGELDQLFEQSGVNYDKDAADKIREANG